MFQKYMNEFDLTNVRTWIPKLNIPIQRYTGGCRKHFCKPTPLLLNKILTIMTENLHFEMGTILLVSHLYVSAT
jgi:hypothetical protein